MYFSYSGIPLSKCRQSSREGLHLLILTCLWDLVASALSSVMVQKAAVVYSIYPLEVEGTLLHLVQHAWLLQWSILR